MTMFARFAVPFAILAVLFLPLPFVISVFVFSVLLAVRTRGEPRLAFATVSRPAAPLLLRGPPR
jgi:hypothetical protein